MYMKLPTVDPASFSILFTLATCPIQYIVKGEILVGENGCCNSDIRGSRAMKLVCLYKASNHNVKVRPHAGWSARSAWMINFGWMSADIRTCSAFCIQQYVKSTEIEKKSISWMEKDDAITSTLFIIIWWDRHQVDRGWIADWRWSALHLGWYHLHIHTTFSSDWSSSCGRTFTEIHEELCTVCGPNCMSIQMVQKWKKMFKEGWQSIEDEEHSCRASDSTNSLHNVQQVHGLLENDNNIQFAIAKLLSHIHWENCLQHTRYVKIIK